MPRHKSPHEERYKKHKTTGKVAPIVTISLQEATQEATTNWFALSGSTTGTGTATLLSYGYTSSTGGRSIGFDIYNDSLLMEDYFFKYDPKLAKVLINEYSKIFDTNTYDIWVDEQDDKNTFAPKFYRIMVKDKETCELIFWKDYKRSEILQIKSKK